jgi:hypothetical protein
MQRRIVGNRANARLIAQPGGVLGNAGISQSICRIPLLGISICAPSPVPAEPAQQRLTTRTSDDRRISISRGPSTSTNTSIHFARTRYCCCSLGGL